MTIFNTQAQPGQYFNPITGASGPTQNLGGQVNGTYQDLSRQAGSQPYQNNKNAANAGYNYVNTGYTYGVGPQTLSQQSKTYTPANPADMRGNVGAGPTNPGQMTWDQWAQQMQKNYGTGQGGTLGGTAQPGVIPGIHRPGTVYPAGYTGYGNSHIGGPQTRTTDLPQAPIPVGTGSGTGNGSVPLAPPPNGSGMNAIQQLINQAQAPVVNRPQQPLAPPPPGAGFVLKPPVAPAPITTAPLAPYGGSFLINKPGHNTQ